MSAYLAAAFAALFLALLSLLHFIKGSDTPAWHTISQYALGKNGWVMQLAFYLLASACLALSVAVEPYPGTKLAAILLLLCAASTFGAGYFKTDPLEPQTSRRATESFIHNVCSLILIPLCPISATVIARELVISPMFVPAQSLLSWLTILTWVGFGCFVATSLYYRRGGRKLTPGTPVGFFNRLMVTTYAIWIITTGLVIATLR